MHFVYLCGKTFAELDGHDPVMRSCPACQLQVLDFDRLTADEQAEYLALQARVGENPCVTMTVPAAQETVSCKEHHAVLARHITGRVALPVSGEEFRQELASYPNMLVELQRRYKEVEPRRKELLTLARDRARKK